MNKKNGENSQVVGSVVDFATNSLDFVMACLGLPGPFSIVKSGVSFGKRIYEKNFLEKLLSFLNGCKPKNKKQQEKMEKFCKEKILNQESYETNGNLLCNCLLKSDDNRKAKLIGKLFSYCVENCISAEMFFTIVSGINSSYYYNLEAIVLFKLKNELYSSEDERLSFLYPNFLTISRFDGGSASDDALSGIVYSINRFGEILLKVFEK